ncbi:hypothetical protein [Hephaestia mangrovi]|uniref:hypothetical protein n=1 Tax=Hephaestia mangrovi TaxID=2873268 RepID=UPI001CA7935E|nr:hypothetical protein [Hephaestia mangrovi]MBY8827227.1 hypothetical protein [Hephaestia mangrovi]
MRNVLLTTSALAALLAAPVLAQDHGHGAPQDGRKQAASSKEAGRSHQTAPRQKADRHQQAAQSITQRQPAQHQESSKRREQPEHQASSQQRQQSPHQAAPQQHEQPQAAQDRGHARPGPQQQAQGRPGSQSPQSSRDHSGNDRQQGQTGPGGQPGRQEHGHGSRTERQPAPNLTQLRQRAQQERQHVAERALWRSSQPQARKDRPKPDRRPVVVTDRAYVAQLPRQQHHFVDGCPPGHGCLPPGQVKQLYAARHPSDGWWRWRQQQDAAYRYDSGYVYRINPATQTIVSYVPVLGGALAVGNAWPSNYAVEQAPDYYADYYGDYNKPYAYRYADNVLYGVDPQSNQIEQIAALLTGSDWSIGQAMPDGYGIYNVPYDYRDRYYDTSDAWYRYDDGYVYRIDPKTRLIEAAIQLLA